MVSEPGGRADPDGGQESGFVVRADGSVIGAKNNSEWWSGQPLSATCEAGRLDSVPEKAPRIGTRNWTNSDPCGALATSVALTVAYFKP